MFNFILFPNDLIQLKVKMFEDSLPVQIDPIVVFSSYGQNLCSLCILNYHRTSLPLHFLESSFMGLFYEKVYFFKISILFLILRHFRNLRFFKSITNFKFVDFSHHYPGIHKVSIILLLTPFLDFL